MNKNLSVLIIVLIILIGGGLFIANPKVQKPTEEAVTQKEPVSTSYVSYSKDVLERATDKRRVLFFYANWCPICRPADADFKTNSNRIPEDVTVIRVNYNDSDTDQEEKDLAKKYGITYQHTFVQIDDEGQEIKKWNGGKLDELLENLQ